jgi:hypothetical protein
VKHSSNRFTALLAWNKVAYEAVNEVLVLGGMVVGFLSD